MAATNTGFSVVCTYRNFFYRKYGGDEYEYKSEKLKSFKTEKEALDFALDERRNLRSRYAETLYVINNADNSSVKMVDRNQVVDCAKPRNK